MAAEPSPAFQFYPKDFLTSRVVRLMSMEARGVYITLLAVSWLDGALPTSTDELAKIAGCSARKLKMIWPNIACAFTLTDAGYVNARLEKEREKQRGLKAESSEKGRKGASARWHGHSSGNSSRPSSGDATANAQAMPGDGFSISDRNSQIAEQEHTRERVLDSGLLDAAVTERAGRFIERYEAAYTTHRKGARYLVKPHRDYEAAVGLCRTWPDDRLDKLAAIFLTTDHEWAERGSRTIPQFSALASWCDSKLTEWEQKQAGTRGA